MSQTLADTSRSSLRYIKETDWGEIPASGDMKALRFTGEQLMVERATVVSDEIRDDRQISSLIPTKSEASGTVDGEMSFKSYDDFLESALFGQWGTLIDVTLGSATIANNVISCTAATIPASLVPGVALKMNSTGFTGNLASNNRNVVVTDVDRTAGEITVIPAVADVGSAVDIEVKGQLLKNGVNMTSFYIEKEFADVNKILSYSGMVVNGMDMQIEAENKVTVQFTMIGKDGATQTASQNPGSAITPSPDTQIMAASAQDGMVLENGVSIGLIKSLGIQITNNLRINLVIGKEGGEDIGVGRFILTGSISLYFKDYAIYAKFLEGETTSLVLTLKDDDSGAYVLYLPKVKFTDSKIVAGGVDQDVMVESGYQALSDVNTGGTFLLTKIEN